MSTLRLLFPAVVSIASIALAGAGRGQGPGAAAGTLPDFGGRAQWKLPEQTVLGSELVSVPIDLSARYTAVEVMIDGRGPFRFNVDTGASLGGAIDSSLARELGLAAVSSVQNSDGTGQTVRRSLVRVGSIRLGKAEFRGVKLLVEDFSWVSPKGTPATRGILGFPLFSKLLLTIDYPAETIELSRGVLPGASAADVIEFDGRDGIPTISILIGNDRFGACIDTGSPSGLTLPKSYLRLIETATKPRVVAHGRSAYSRFTYFGAELERPMLLADQAFERLDAMFARAFDTPLLGYEVLREFSITFDQKTDRVRFVRAADTDDRTAEAPKPGARRPGRGR